MSSAYTKAGKWLLCSWFWQNVLELCFHLGQMHTAQSGARVGAEFRLSKPCTDRTRGEALRTSKRYRVWLANKAPRWDIGRRWPSVRRRLHGQNRLSGSMPGRSPVLIQAKGLTSTSSTFEETTDYANTQHPQQQVL
jgi:hypothetical protein